MNFTINTKIITCKILHFLVDTQNPPLDSDPPTPPFIPPFIPESQERFLQKRKPETNVFINFSVTMKSCLAKGRRKRDVVFSEPNLKEN